ncbi:TetR family transcriptional regulator [Streptomyces sp. HNM0574]|uniref:TetR/AcrR family transcriptional regulator n=1 Tax=Streptomyces sp. HNM0574 TaxID=2714954 RepID=UPI00146C6F12|nr:TetR/AcrR family transcriptional regulator [Streptomyces sp. HNM0574]
MSARPAGAARGRGRPASAARGADEPATRDRILVAARTEFAERGYDKASVRAIARRAEVDSALVHHYFGTKEGVFGAAVEGAFAPALAAPDLVSGILAEGGGRGAGERLVRFMFAIWDNEPTREPILAIVRSAVSNETAARIFRELLTRQVVGRITAEVDLPDIELRAELAVAQLVGVALMRYVIKLEPVASEDPEELIARLAPVVERHLTGA